jgi:hypothetical protein
LRKGYCEFGGEPGEAFLALLGDGGRQRSRGNYTI